jgi:hypothetical protein
LDPKKKIKIAVIVVCLVATGIILLVTQSGEKGSVESIDSDALIWVKCGNPECNAEYESNKKAYWIEARAQSSKSRTTPPQTCEKCRQQALFRAEKCVKCDQVFFHGGLGDMFPDRCPCGYSKQEEIRKNRAAAK